ncbi:MAG: nucleoside transporter C-terminal domain-containing protein [Vampirovibrionales bacterium]|nr:nucleoside transporter C-terminal domain-containing protein [Vampirovibrionales bacterium]
MLIPLLGIALILLVATLVSSDRKAINWHLVARGLALQTILAFIVLNLPAGRWVFQTLGHGIEALLKFSDAGASFVFGDLLTKGTFIFAFKLVPTIIFVSALVSIAYHIGLLQKVVSAVAWCVSRVLGVSGAEALSNAASVFVGQVEAQLLVRPYLATMTRSELLTVMAGSMACIAGGVMAVYIQMGVDAAYLLAASLMAIPGALVMAKIVLPETQMPVTAGKSGMAQAQVPIKTVNLIDATAHGALEGMKIGIAVCAVLVAFIALIAAADGVLAWASKQVLGNAVTFKQLVGFAFQPIAFMLGVPAEESRAVGALLGTKLVVNEFVAYADLAPQMLAKTLSPRAITVATFALCGFANLGSIAIQVGGIGEMIPERKHELAQLGLRALLCGTAASYISAALAGLLIAPPLPWLPVALLLVACAGLAMSLMLGRKTAVAGAVAANSASAPVTSTEAANAVNTPPEVLLPGLSQVYGAAPSTQAAVPEPTVPVPAENVRP